MNSNQILIVEDDVGIRELTQKYLLSRGYRVHAVGHGEEAFEQIKQSPPDLILLDIELPGEDGFAICKKIRETLNVPIIFMSVRRRTMDKIKCFELGGDDYVTKPFKFIELEARIKAVLRRYQTDAMLYDDVLTFGDLEIHLNTYTCYVNGKEVPLSIKEMELLVHFATNPNQVWSHEQLYDHVWSFDGASDLSTVKVHVSRLRRKLEKDPSKPQYIKTVRGFGYMFEAKQS
ncbi:MAG TPA: response regulator transcription factor [Pseudogracilibacillus sp.]|nr:response regulator transcription factor [Pseudogracilibacillus sp.]